MNAQDYPIAHFEFMSRLTDAFAGLQAQLLRHNYDYEHFGSWEFLVRYRGRVSDVSYDGKESEMAIRYSTDRKPPYNFGRYESIVLDKGQEVDSPESAEKIVECIKKPIGNIREGTA